MNSIDSSLPYLGIRLTHPDEQVLTDFKTFLTAYDAPLILVIEEADEEVNRTHTHSLIQTEITINTFRKQLKKKFPLLNGNKDYQLTQIKDPNAMLRYVAKGKKSTPPQVLFSNFNPELVAQYHLDYWKENDKLKQTHKQRPVAKSKTWTELCWEDVQKKVNPFENAERKHIELITEIVLIHLGSTARKLSKKIISDMVWGFANALIIRHSPHATTAWSKLVADEIFRDHPFSFNYE